MPLIAVCPNRGYTQTRVRPQYAFTWQQRTHSYTVTCPSYLDLCIIVYFLRCRVESVRPWEGRGSWKTGRWGVRQTSLAHMDGHAHSAAWPWHSIGIHTHTCRQRTLLKRDANRRLIGQLVVAHVKYKSDVESYSLYIDRCLQKILELFLSFKWLGNFIWLEILWEHLN